MSMNEQAAMNARNKTLSPRCQQGRTWSALFLIAWGCLSGLAVTADAAVLVRGEDSAAPISSEKMEPVGAQDLPMPRAEDQVILTKMVCGGPFPVRVSSEDEIWLVSARGSDCFPCDRSQLKVCLLHNGYWQTASLDDLVNRHTIDKTRATLIYAHGNRTNLEYAKARGLQVYQTAFQNSPCVRPPIRFVLFCWKSEKEIRRRPVADFGIKSDRAVSVGKTFALLLNQFEDRNLGILGFSLGTQVTMSALNCLDLQDPNGRWGKYRVMLIAPALDPGFVRSELPRYPHTRIVEKTDVYRNRNDRAINAAQTIVRKKSRADVTTLRELAASNRASLNPIKVYDITNQIRKLHSITNYCAAHSVRTGLAQMLNGIVATAAQPLASEFPLAPPAAESIVAPAE
jgi:esterase/lipase superfamily enzyme